MVFFYFSCAVTDCCSDPSLPLFCHWAQKHLTGTSLPSLTSLTPSLGLVCQISVGFLVSLFWTCFWESKRELGVKFKQIFSFCFSFYQQTCNTTCNWRRTINVSLPNTGQLWFLCFRLPSTSEKCWHWKKKLKCVQRYMSGYTGPESVKLLEKSNVITVKCHSPSLQWTY